MDKHLLLILGIFTASRAVLYTLFPFRVDFLPWLNQLLDIHLLRTDLWASLMTLHMTPPLYNLYVGLLLMVPESLLQFSFQSFHFLLGLGMVAMTYLIVKRLSGSTTAALLAGLAFTLYPILFRFEIIPFYTYPLAFLVLASVFNLMRFVDTGKASWFIATLLAPAILVLTRNFFHAIVYFLPIAVGVLILVYRTRRTLFVPAILAATLLFSLTLVPSIVNQARYGIFASSTWQGMQLFSMTRFVPEEKVQGLIDEGRVTPLALLPRFQNPDLYYDYYGEAPRDGHPALTALYKEEGGGIFGNFNNEIYIKTAEEYGQNTLAIMVRYPQYFVERFVNSVYIFFGFANYRFFDETEKWLVFTGGPVMNAYQSTKYFVAPALFALLFLLVLWYLVRDRRNPVSLYTLFILLYTFGVSNVVEIGENYTARVPIDPLIIITITVALAPPISRYLRYTSSGRQTDATPPAR